MATTQYRYLFADLITNDILAEMPLTNVSFTQALNTPGSFSGRILGSDARELGYDITGSTEPARTALYVDRDGVLIWGGIIWLRTWNTDTQSFDFSAREFGSYFERRRIAGAFMDGDQALVYDNEDQLFVAQDLLTLAQSIPGGNIGVVVPNNVSGIDVTRVYYDYEVKDVWGAIKDLSNQQDGFDFNIDVAYDSNLEPRKYASTSYPYRGTPYNAANADALVFEFPGNIVAYEWPDDGSVTTNYMYGIGPNSNEAKIRAEATAPVNQIAAGWPLLEDSVSYTDQYDPDLLYQQTLGEVTAKQVTVVTPKIIVPAYAEPVLGSYKTGDECLLRITDDRFPNNGYGFGLSVVKRIVAISVQPGEDGPERVTLTLTDPTLTE
jgi:hypothetical protein